MNALQAGALNHLGAGREDKLLVRDMRQHVDRLGPQEVLRGAFLGPIGQEGDIEERIGLCVDRQEHAQRPIARRQRLELRCWQLGGAIGEQVSRAAKQARLAEQRDRCGAGLAQEERADIDLIDRAAREEPGRWLAAQRRQQRLSLGLGDAHVDRTPLERQDVGAVAILDPAAAIAADL